MEKKIRKWKELGKTDKLLKVLSNDNFKNRVEALNALGELRDKRVIEEVKKLIYDPVRPVINAAIEALEKIGISTELKDEIEKRKIELSQLDVHKKERREEKWREKTEEEIKTDLERRAKMIRIHEIEKEARAVHGKNSRRSRIAEIIALIIGGPKSR